MNQSAFHVPTERERAFLRVVTRGYNALERQVELCEISDYDVTGYYDVRIPGGEPMETVASNPLEGPLLRLTDADAPQPGIVQIGEPHVILSVRDEPSVRVPYILPDNPRLAAIDVLLWTDERGLLTSIEVCSLGDGFVVDPCSAFVDADNAKSERLIFRCASQCNGTPFE